MSYTVALEKFQGPLDLLLQLIEQRELDITEIALVEIADSFIAHLDTIEETQPEELADFLVVATKLLHIKSRALLPMLEMEDEEEESAAQLAAHLRMYKEFRDASERLVEQIEKQEFALARPSKKVQYDTVEFSPPEEVTLGLLHTVFKGILENLETVIKIPEAAIRKAITVKERIQTLSTLLTEHAQLSFNQLMGRSQDKVEIVVTFLAVLELVKMNRAQVTQDAAYSDITIQTNT